MICPNCGEEVREGSRFCGSCGAKIETVTETAAENIPETASVDKEPEASAASSGGAAGRKQGGKLSVKLIAIVAVAAVVVILAVVFVGSISGDKTLTINVNDYVEVTFSGYDTIGTASVTFDYDSFSEDYADLDWDTDALYEYVKTTLTDYADENSEITDEEIEEALAEFDEEFDDAIAELTAYDPTEAVYEVFYYSMSLDQTSGLSNGDVVTLSWNVDEDILEYLPVFFGCEFECSDVEFTVAELEELETYDPFDVIDVSFSGVSPDGTVTISITGNDEIAQSLSFSADRVSGLALGDTVTVTVDTAADAFTESQGIILSPTEKTFTVEGLSSYITSVEQIPDDDLEQMKQEVSDSYASHAAENWMDSWSLLGIDFIGSYLLSGKSGSGNILYLVYQVNAEYFSEELIGFTDEVYTFYCYAGYEDLILTDAGELDVDYLDFDIVTNQYIISSDTYVYGYGTLDEGYKSLVTAKADEYTCEDTVVDQVFDYEPVQMDNLAGIPDDAVEYNGHYYKVYEVGEGMSWEEAEAHCELRGGHLATITSEEEMAAVVQKAYSSSKDYWIGGYYDTEDGQWKWVTGEEMEYSCWDSNAIKDSTDSVIYPYMIMKPTRWYTSDSGFRHDGNYAVGYVCEWDSEDLQ